MYYFPVFLREHLAKTSKRYAWAESILEPTVRCSAVFER